MPEGRRWGVDNPSPAMKSFTAYINENEGEDFVSEAQVASTFIHHREWQQGHAQELVEERRIAKEKRDADAEKRKLDREQKKAEKDAEKDRPSGPLLAGRRDGPGDRTGLRRVRARDAEVADPQAPGSGEDAATGRGVLRVDTAPGAISGMGVDGFEIAEAGTL